MTQNMTQNAFEFDLQNAFAAQPEPDDAGFSVAVAKRLARREGGRWHILALGLAAALAVSLSGLNLSAIQAAWAPLALALANFEPPWIGVDFTTAMDIAGWSLVQMAAALGKASPYAVVIVAVSAGAVAYAAQTD